MPDTIYLKPPPAISPAKPLPEITNWWTFVWRRIRWALGRP